MSDNILFSFLLGFIILIFILIVGINIKNKKVRYNSIKCLEAEKNLLMQKIEFNKQHLNEDPINLQNTIYEDNIRVNSINDEIFWRYVQPSVHRFRNAEKGGSGMQAS